jgi:hypothetical protein
LISFPCFFEIGSHYITQAGVELAVLKLNPLASASHYRGVPPYLASFDFCLQPFKNLKAIFQLIGHSQAGSTKHLNRVLPRMAL